MARSDDQQKLISFRVEDEFLRKFEALKERFSVSGKKTSTSDLARSLIESASLQQGEFGELLADQAESIKHIQQLSQTRQPLRRAQWEFLSFLVHRAYQNNRRQMVQGCYFRTVLQAFAAWRQLIEGQDFAQADQYFLSNLRDTGTNDLQKRIDELIATMPILTWNAQAEFGARNFNVAMRDGLENIHALDLNEALAPYLPNLIPVAIRAVHLHTGKPLREVEHDFSSPPINPIRTEHYWLTILISGSSLNAGLNLSTHRSLHPLSGFLQFQEFAQLLEEVSTVNSMANSETYSITGSTSEDSGYYLRYLGHQMEFTREEFKELRDLFQTALLQPDVKEAIRKMVAIYGDI